MSRDYNVKLVGCDADTQTVVHLSDEHAEIVRFVAEAVTAESSYSCHPRMVVWPVGETAPELSYPDEDEPGGAA